MSFKDRFDRLIDYFTEDGDEYDVQEAPAQAVGASQPVSSPKPVQPSSKPRPKAVVAAKEQKPTPVAASRPQVASTAVVESASSQKSSSEILLDFINVNKSWQEIVLLQMKRLQLMSAILVNTKKQLKLLTCCWQTKVFSLTSNT